MSHHIEIKQLNSHGGQKINMKISITTQIDRLTIRDSFGSTFKKFNQPQDILCLILDNCVVAQ